MHWTKKLKADDFKLGIENTILKVEKEVLRYELERLYNLTKEAHTKYPTFLDLYFNRKDIKRVEKILSLIQGEK